MGLCGVFPDRTLLADSFQKNVRTTMSAPTTVKKEGKKSGELSELSSPCAFASSDEDDKCRGEIVVCEMAGTGWRLLVCV